MFLEKHLLSSEKINLVLDVGANVGQTGRGLRKQGYLGRIASFEPLQKCYEKLAQAASTDPNWVAHHMALGKEACTTRMVASEHLATSSLRSVTDELRRLHPGVAETHVEEVRVERLDQILPKIAQPQDKIHLKVDTQGYEQQVIEGAIGAIDRIFSVKLELALSEMYTGETLMPETAIMMRGLGFTLIDMSPVFRDPVSGELLHVDLLFRKGGPTERLGPMPKATGFRAVVRRWNRERLNRRHQKREANSA